MHAATTRMMIAAAGLAAIGLAAWPHQATTPLTQQGVPTVHRDVALVDILTDEDTFDSSVYSQVVGPTGAEETLSSDLTTAFGATDAAALLDNGGVYTDNFNGAETGIFDGLYTDGLAFQDEVNQSLGSTDADSQAAIVTELTGEPEAVTSAQLTELTAAEGTSAFDTDLTTIANADLTSASTDFGGYLTSVASDPSAFGELSTLLTDFDSTFSDLLSNVSTDFSTLFTSLGL